MASNVAYSAALSKNPDLKSKHVSGMSPRADSHLLLSLPRAFVHPKTVWAPCGLGRGQCDVTRLHNQFHSRNTTEVLDSGT